MESSAARGSLLFLGDSLIAGGDWAAWFPEHEAINRGIPGETTDALLNRIDAVLAEHPDAIVLLSGSNDLAQRLGVEHVVRNLEYALVAIRRDLPSVRMLLLSILPRSSEFAGAIRDANRHLRQFAPSVNAQYLDLWPALSSADALAPEFSDDGVHLNASGYQAWLAELRPAVDRLENAPPMSGAIPLP